MVDASITAVAGYRQSAMAGKSNISLMGPSYQSRCFFGRRGNPLLDGLKIEDSTNSTKTWSSNLQSSQSAGGIVKKTAMSWGPGKSPNNSWPLGRAWIPGPSCPEHLALPTRSSHPSAASAATPSQTVKITGFPMGKPSENANFTQKHMGGSRADWCCISWWRELQVHQFGFMWWGLNRTRSWGVTRWCPPVKSWFILPL